MPRWTTANLENKISFVLLFGISLTIGAVAAIVLASFIGEYFRDPAAAAFSVLVLWLIPNAWRYSKRKQLPDDDQPRHGSSIGQMIPSGVLLVLLWLTIALLSAAYAFRYQTVSISDSVYVINRWSGDWTFFFRNVRVPVSDKK